MTPAARVAAAIGVLDAVLDGAPAEKALTNWGRAARYAGSGDRAAVRDLVFGALRCRRSFAALGGAETGRGLIIGAERAAGRDPAGLFTGERHAPAPLSFEEREAGHPPRGRGERLDLPDWLLPELDASLGADLEAIAEALRARAPVYLRANLARADREAVREALLAEGIASEPHPLARGALRVTEGARRVRGSRCYNEGLVELQDVASQAVTEELLPLSPGARVLDYCAGGGGKSLALAALAPEAEVFAHDADPRRMSDLPARAQRAGARIRILEGPRLSGAGPFELVLADVPCSGSGAWRRQPEAKWTLTPARLDDLRRTQAGILRRAAALVAPGGRLAYATCSLLSAENAAQVAAFLADTPGWQRVSDRRFTPLDGGDGFYVAQLKRE